DEAEFTQNLFFTLRSARERASPARFARQKGEAEALQLGSVRYASAYGPEPGHDRETISQRYFDFGCRPSMCWPMSSKFDACACTCCDTECMSRKRRSNGLSANMAVAPAAW